MTDFDKIFQKSNTDESVKKGKMLFGRLLIKLRGNSSYKLYSLLESVENSRLEDNVLNIVLTDKTSYEMINNKSDIDALNKTLDTIQSGVTIQMTCEEKQVFDLFKFEERLKNEFGRILTIK